MENFLKMASPLAMVAGMAGFAMTGSAFAGGPGEQSYEWETPPIVESAPSASQSWDWKDLATATTPQTSEYEYLPPAATTPLAQPTEQYAQKPLTSASSASCPTPAISPCGTGRHLHPHRAHPRRVPTYTAPIQYPAPIYTAPPVYQQPQLPVYRDRIVEKKVFVDRPVERKVYVNRPIYVDRPVYVNRPVPVEKRVPVPVDRPVYIEKRVAVPVVKHVAVPVDRPVYVEKRVAVPVVQRVPVPVDRPVYVERPVPVPVPKPVPVYHAPVQNSCSLATIAQPAYSNGCYGQGGGYGQGYAAPASYTAPVPASYTSPVVNGGYEYFGNSGYGAIAGYGAENCCGRGYTGGHFYGGHSKHDFKQVADHIAQISARIADGENDGMITAMEAANLRKRIQDVSKELTTARQAGQFEEREIEVVAASVRQLAEQMKIVKQNEKIAEEQQKLADQYANAYGFGAQGITAAHLRPNYGAANAFLPSAQYPALQQTLPFAYGGMGGMGGFGTY